jgi:uncharacterized membrane protein YczE
LTRDLIWRWLFFFVGLAVLCCGVSMTIEGNVLGVGPWDVLHIALFHKIGLTIGTWSIITGLIVVVSTSLYLKEWPKVATWINMILCGLFIDFFNWILPSSPNLFFDIFYFLIGVIILGVGCAMYISPKLGAGPRDTLMIIFAKKLGGSIGKARLAMEALIAVLGWLLGGPIGVGTVIIALFTGYIVQYSLPYFQRMLDKKIHGPKNGNLETYQDVENLANES